MERKYIIGYLILAHQYPDQLARLINTLDNDEVVFFVHIDKASPLGDFQRMVPGNSRIFFLKQRVNVFWMGYSMVTATLLLIEAALRCPMACRYYVLLSGTDYPIKSNRYLLDFYRNSENQFMGTFRLEDAPGWTHKIVRYHFFDTNIFNPRGWLCRRLHRPYLVVIFFYQLIQRILPKRRFPLDMEPYGGGQFWSLTAECLSYLYRCIKTDKTIARFYRFTHSPDEMVFPTVLMNSDYGVKVRDQPSEHFWDHGQKLVTEYGNCLRYVDWHPDRELPAILKDEDFEELMASEYHFARKFCPRRSRSLMEKIDSVISRST